MKPIGLSNKHNNLKPYAVVQLRQDNSSATLYNIVGFQTKMKYKDQTEIFRSLPGLKGAKFARLGGLHRNTFINSPLIIDKQLRFKKTSSYKVCWTNNRCGRMLKVQQWDFWQEDF